MYVDLKEGFLDEKEVQNQFLFQNEKNVQLWLKREDLLHAEVSGNKFRKLKYNILAAKEKSQETVLTFGGAFSNHIAAVAAAGKMFGLKTIGIIRGEELGKDLDKTLRQNPTLRYAASCGMQLHFVSREDYRQKASEAFISKLKNLFGDFYLVPEGGTNELAVKGCEEILNEADADFDVVCCPVGTGGTISGLINASFSNQKIFGFPALKGDFLKSEIEKYTSKTNWKLVHDYHFGGYAKLNKELVEFINGFKKEYGVQLDPIYTGKMVYGILEMVNTGIFQENTRILALHTGGLQGIPGMNNFLKSKKLPLIAL